MSYSVRILLPHDTENSNKFVNHVLKNLGLDQNSQLLQIHISDSGICPAFFAPYLENDRKSVELSHIFWLLT